MSLSMVIQCLTYVCYAGSNLRDGGPASLFLGFAVVCSCVWAVIQTVSEMTIAFPTSGNFIDYADRFVDRALSFAAGFSMWIGWTAIIASEATFFSVIVNYWANDKVPEAVCLPNTVIGWFEYFTSILKIVALILFVIIGVALIFGAGADGTVHNGENWQNGMAFLNGFKGFGNSVLLAILAIGDNTFTGFLAGESKSPRYSVAHAVFLIPIRVAVFYLVSVVIIGILISPKNPPLLGSSGVAASPFVIAINQAGIKGLPDLLNVVILFAVAAIAAESFFVASRILQSMAHQGLISSCVAKVDSRGRPRVSLGITAVLTIVMTYINLSGEGTTVFNWLSQIASTGFFMVWFKSTWWPFPPIWLFTCSLFYIGCSFYLALYPIRSDTPTAYYFFQYMIGLILIVASTIAYKIIFQTKLRDPRKVDLQTGRRPLSVGEIRELDEYERLPRWRKFVSFVQLW
ncbi:amino acid permease-domain-containing protein [Talaromyces proteolyticus]|uniref:Amino acid permease-domain-containing protein n=1 Tax=Talaromyces proteolyticus TaxID=1131652 RepID=A0AAD4L4W1_9EURO|nr:amino acid permease-domain-containing protein [Talaromyces proteolyticus]KAH8705938.1 amino acid permease-domain-containing protein [Talaromyces proteolyticus]